MKLQITFNKPFEVFCKISETEKKSLMVKPGQYLVLARKTENSFEVEHDTFFFSVPRDLWISGKFFLENDISIRYLQEMNLIDQ